MQKKQDYLERERERGRLRRKSPEYQKQRAEYHARHYQANKDRIIESRAAFWDSLSPEQKQLRLNKMHASSQAYMQRYYKMIYGDPSLMAEHQERKRTHRIKALNKKALADMLKDVNKLIIRSDKNGNTDD